MSQAADLIFAIKLGDGRTIAASPKADEPIDLQSMADRQLVIRPTDADQDTAGHSLSDDVLVDVEGHAMTLRLPTTADAVALRRALAVGAVTATILAAGAVAAMQGQQPAGTTVGVGNDQPAPVQDYNRHGSHPE